MEGWKRRAEKAEAERDAIAAAAFEAAARWLIRAGLAGDAPDDPLASCIRALASHEARAALDRLIADKVAEALKDKPLEWETVVDRTRGSFVRRKWEASSDFGVVYEIWDYDVVLAETGEPAHWHKNVNLDERYCLNVDGRSRMMQQKHPTLEAAKAAAQADYEARIRAALATPSHQEGGHDA